METFAGTVKSGVDPAGRPQQHQQIRRTVTCWVISHVAILLHLGSQPMWGDLRHGPTLIHARRLWRTGARARAS